MTEEVRPMTDSADDPTENGSQPADTLAGEASNAPAADAANALAGDASNARKTDAAPSTLTATPALLPLNGGARALPKVFSVKWWNAAVVAVWEFRKFTLKPAIIIAATTFAYVGSLNWVVSTFAKHGNEPWMANEFLTSVFIAIPLLLGTVIVTLVGVTWSIGLWFIVLTAFCRSFLSVIPETASRAEIVASQQEAIAHFKVNKRLVLSTWLVYSILMTFPGMWLLIAFAVYAFAAYPASTGAGPPPAQSLILFCAITGGGASILLTNHALLLFAYSSVSSKGGRAVALDSLKATLLSFPLITIVSTISLAVAAVVIGVVGLLVFGQPQLINFDGLMWLWILVLSAWHGVSSMVVLPLLMVVPCEMIRGSIE